MRRHVQLLALVAVTVARALPLHAQVNCANPAAAAPGASARDLLSLLARVNCLGGETDKDPLTVNARKQLARLDNSTASTVERRLMVLSVMDQVRGAVTGMEQNATTPAARGMLTALKDSLVLARAAVDAGLTAADSVRLVQTRSWAWEPALFQFNGLGVNVGAVLDPECPTFTSANCAQAFQLASGTLRTARLVEAALNYYAKPLLGAALAHASMRDARWTAYFDETLVQFPWELGLNSWRFSRKAKRSRGFVLPPSNQLIFLHPMAGLEYIGSVPEGSRLEPAVGLEVLGFNFWKWNDSNEPATAFGLSVVAAFSDRQGTQAGGIGVLARYNHRYAVTTTFRAGKVGVMLSTDVGQWIVGKQQQAKDAMRLLGGGGN